MPVYEDSSSDLVSLGAGLVPATTTAVNGHRPVDPLDAITVELDTYFHLLTTLNGVDSTEVFQTLSGISARASEIRHHLVSNDSRRPTALRTKHIDPLLDEVDRQFKFHSRIQACRQFEWDASKGQT